MLRYPLSVARIATKKNYLLLGNRIFIDLNVIDLVVPYGGIVNQALLFDIL